MLGIPDSVLAAAIASGEVDIKDHDSNALAEHLEHGPTVLPADPDERIGLTAAGLQFVATGRGPDDEPAIFRVLVAGNVHLHLRVSGNAAAAFLAALEVGDRVEVRLLPPAEVVDRPARGASWARVGVTVNGGDATLLLPGSEP